MVVLEDKEERFFFLGFFFGNLATENGEEGFVSACSAFSEGVKQKKKEEVVPFSWVAEGSQERRVCFFFMRSILKQ